MGPDNPEFPAAYKALNSSGRRPSKPLKFARGASSVAASSSTLDAHLDPAPHPHRTNPPLPTRSPLRPPARAQTSPSPESLYSLTPESRRGSISTGTPIADAYGSAQKRTTNGENMLFRGRASRSTSVPLDTERSTTTTKSDNNVRERQARGPSSSLRKEGRTRSRSTLVQSVSGDTASTTSTLVPSISDDAATATSTTTATSSGESLLSGAPTVGKVSKRTHALLELLSSERAYASDLAFIRDIHIPLALGLQDAFQLPPATEHTNIRPSSSTMTSSASSVISSTSSPPNTLSPMSRDDTKIIFGNIAELAAFSDMLTERLEEALGCVLHEGQREDHVGELLLDMIPILEPPYRMYITRHPTALQHLNSLPKTPALAAYLARTRDLASSVTHAWDLPSLLIKPVQRLLKYSLLLTAILEETPDDHPDKENLKLAKRNMEEVAMGVNEGRRRREVVKEVLNRSGTEGLKKKVAAVGVSIPVNLQRMGGSLRRPKVKDGNEEEAQVKLMGRELQICVQFMRDLYKRAIEWSASVLELDRSLSNWAVSFAGVLGLAEDAQSEAFDAFLFVLHEHMQPLCEDLDSLVKSRVLVDLTKLVESTQSPLRLLEVMSELRPLHYNLLNINIAKARPAAALLEASQSFVALRGQLFAELPQYLALLERGLTACLVQLSLLQIKFWAEMREKWADLWEALKAEDELNVGADETETVWWGKWSRVEESMNALFILSQQRKFPAPTLAVEVPHQYLVTPPSATLSQFEEILNMVPGEVGREERWPASSPVISNMLSTLEPATFQIPRQHQRRDSREDAQSVRRAVWRTESKSYDEEDEDWDRYRSVRTPTSTSAPSSPARTKSAPSNLNTNGRIGLPTFSTTASTPARADDAHLLRPDADHQRERLPRRPSLRQKLSGALRPSSRGPSPSRKSRPSTEPASHRDYHNPSTWSASDRARWQQATAKYLCRVVHPSVTPPGAQYRDVPFFSLEVNQTFEVLHEFGHPSAYADLPLYVDDGEDCLMLVRDGRGRIGWALASFLIPID